MFVERSAGRIRLVRRLFVLCGLAPLVGLGAVAVWRHGDTRRGWLEDRIAAALATPVAIGTVSDPRPGVMLLGNVVLGDGATGAGVAVRFGRVRVEESGAEIRIAIDAAECPPEAAALVARLARVWQEGAHRFRRDWVVDCARLGWGDGASAPRLERVRVECVATAGARAVRLHGSAADGAVVDMRILRSQEGVTGAVHDECEARFESPVPAAVIARGLGLDGLVCGTATTLRGEARLARDGGGWSGHCSGEACGVDLGALTAGLPYGIDGLATIAVEHAEIDAGRITDARFTCRATHGTISRRLVAASVDWLGCRPLRALAGDAAVGFHEMAWSCRIGGHGIELVGLAGDGALVSDDTGPIVSQPVGVMPADRLAWLVSPPGLPVVPASPWTGVLLPWLPIPTAGHPGAVRIQR